MWKPGDTGEPEFTLILPFTPKNKQIMIGWLAGLCDGDNYGRLLAYKFPKKKRIPGPQQVETKMDDEAIEGLLAGEKKNLPMAERVSGKAPELGRKANQAFNDYLRLQGQKKFKEASRQLEQLQQILQQLAGDQLAEDSFEDE
jgi:hypothetical protein